LKWEIAGVRRLATAKKEDIGLMAHLMRRAGFGATRAELESLADQGYEEIVEQLLDPGSEPPLDEYLLYRFHPVTEMPTQHYSGGQPNWLYHMVNTQRPLQEKMVLFWHNVFATSNDKVDNCDQLISQIEMFRRYGMGNYRELLVQLAKDPAMIFWLDNNENNKRSPNENWGRELLELFSLGVGNYTEQDVFECSRAFTGWTIGAKLPRYPYGRFPWTFEFRPEDHDYKEKTFLGLTGKFNGEDIIDIIVQQPACARYISRHLYSFFVADEPQVPSWHLEPPQNPEAIEVLSLVFAKSGYEIKPVLRTLFNSDFFKEAAWRKVKSPIELVVGTLRLTQEMQGPHPRLEGTASEAGYMGQEILAPPSVESWHTGVGWISSGAHITRVNFVADRISDVHLAGIRDIVQRVASNGMSTTAEDLVERCLDELGLLEVSETTRKALLTEAVSQEAYGAAEEDYGHLTGRIAAVLGLIAGAPEYQLN